MIQGTRHRYVEIKIDKSYEMEKMGRAHDDSQLP